MTALPDTVEKYGQSRIFTETTTPPNFTKHHATRPGVWGRLIVTDGALLFEWADPADVAGVKVTPGAEIVIPPEVAHRVTLDGPVSFFVEFYR